MKSFILLSLTLSTFLAIASSSSQLLVKSAWSENAAIAEDPIVPTNVEPQAPKRKPVS
ncbi:MULTISPECIES: hypothetical protein [unclassified Roseofilum]|uniref:hypothetical protein n=1 Tax=unclassified Roseofilum TaxID=2620099 RepID=UPI001B24E659|nr:MULTISPECIES: hypothetical protein [unclassified Roseofilum]MBP0008885.1 hypothetical protein [Roseofilum sp. Belize Diploria]MBP0033281.1 hypothetical protein [Roseofilum sp. Belize BBD 4]